MDVVIVGNGIAGNSAAESILAVDPRAKITLISDEIFPEYSACALCDYISGELPRKRVFLKSEEDYSELGVDAILGKKVDGFDPVERKIQIGDIDYSYEKLIVATGSEPVLPPINGREKRGVFSLKSLNDAEAILRHKGKKAVVAGSGPIGIEAAVALRKRGYEVHLVELLGSVLPKLLDEECAALVADNLCKNGVDVVVGEGVKEIHGESVVEGISTNRRQIPCDTVILSIGMKPRTELVRERGITFGEHGAIKVNSRMETNLQDVYACGDCAECMLSGSHESVLSLLWFNAKQQGKVAGLNVAGVNRQYLAPMSIIALKIFDTYVASISNPTYTFGQAYEKIEKKIRDGYLRFTLDSGRMIAVQMIGKSDELGVFFSFLKKGEMIEKVRKYVHLREVPSVFPFYARISHYLS